MHILKVYSKHKNTNINTIFFGKNTQHKKSPLFLRAPIHPSFNFKLQFLYGLKHNVHLYKTVRGIFYFPFGFTFIEVYIFVQQNAQTL